MTIDALTVVPSRSDPPEEFKDNADAFMAALDDFVDQLNEAAADFSVTLWVTGTTYAIGDRVWSPADFLDYRRKTAGAGSTDPSADSTNWERSLPGFENTVPRLLENANFTATMASNAVTVALKGIDGNNPSPTNLVGIGFRSPTITSGASSKVQVDAAQSLVIPNGGTMGTVSGVPSRIWVAEILYNGAAELAVCNARSGQNIMAMNEGGLISTTTIGTGSDSAHVWYSNTGRSNVPFTILGYFDSTQATAGVWAADKEVLVVNPKRLPGQVVQSSQVVKTDTFTTTSTTLVDATGVTLSFTPTAKANAVAVSFSGMVSNATGNNSAKGTLLRDAVALGVGDAAGNRTRSTFSANPVNSVLYVFQWALSRLLDWPGSVSALTYKLQMQTLSAGTATLGRDGSDTDIDDSPRTATVLTLEEIMS
jgi:hypothetical protein